MPARSLPRDPIPVFPLPSTVLFPHATLPLFVFEPRYRRMVKDLLAGERWMAVVLLREPETADGDPPAFHDVAGVGQVVRSSRQEAGTYHITVEGRVRAGLREVSSSHPYRLVEAVALPETQSWLAEREGTGMLRRILEAAGRAGIAQAEDAPIRLPRSVERRAALLNLLASSVLADPGERQAMLVADVPERAELLLRQLRIAGDLLAALGRTPPPRDPRVN